MTDNIKMILGCIFLCSIYIGIFIDVAFIDKDSLVYKQIHIKENKQ